MKQRVLLLLIMVLLIPLTSFAKKKKKKTEEVKQETPYEKLFKDKKVETKTGLITLHKIEGKLLFEFPLNLLGREMLLGSTITEITDNNFGSIGEKPKTPLHITFTQTDTVISICEVNSMMYTNDEQIKKRIEESTKPAVIQNFSIKAYNNDSTSVVFDITDYFLSDEEKLNSFSRWAPALTGTNLEKEFKKPNSQILDIKSFEDNISVQSSLTYVVSTRDQNRYYYHKLPFTVVLTRSLILLPEERMRPRLADPRISIFYQGKMEFNTKNRGMEGRYYANRWRLEPADEDAYRKGQLVEVKKPVIFYIDNAFPESWKEYIKLGVEEWQKAFEEIGLKNAIIAKDFPQNDDEFDADNLKYNCVRYSPSWIANAMGPSWTDPRTGEIINASVYLYHNIIKLIQDWRFIHTSPADPNVRKKVLDKETLGESIRYVVAHEIGHCLGFMHNMSASAAIPVDSLRSPSFTQKYGTTYSIMDYARNNYVAQPGDKEKGVKLTPPDLGVYDYYTIKWLYTPLLEANTPEEEVHTLDKWISEKAGNPIYRYGRQQFTGRLDPSSFEEDLGDDAMKAADYGVKNLKYILSNLNQWVGDDDKDFSFRQNIYNEIVYQYLRYINHVIYNIGGIYLNEKYDKDPLPSYMPVPREKQERALKFLLEQLKDMSWIDAPELQKILPMQENLSGQFEDAVFTGLMYRVDALTLCSQKTIESPYTPRIYMNQIYDYIFNPTKQSKTLSNTEKRLQVKFLSHLISGSKVTNKGLGGNSLAIRGVDIPEQIKSKSREAYGILPESTMGIFTNTTNPTDNINFVPEEVQGFGYQYTLGQIYSAMEPVYYNMIKNARTLISGKMNTGNEDTRMHYRLLMHKLEQALK